MAVRVRDKNKTLPASILGLLEPAAGCRLTLAGEHGRSMLGIDIHRFRELLAADSGRVEGRDVCPGREPGRDRPFELGERWNQEQARFHW